MCISTSHIAENGLFPCWSVLFTFCGLWHVLNSQKIYFWQLQWRQHVCVSAQREGDTEARNRRCRGDKVLWCASVTDVHVESMSGVHMHQWPAQPGACMFSVNMCVTVGVCVVWPWSHAFMHERQKMHTFFHSSLTLSFKIALKHTLPYILLRQYLYRFTDRTRIILSELCCLWSA